METTPQTKGDKIIHALKDWKFAFLVFAFVALAGALVVTQWPRQPDLSKNKKIQEIEQAQARQRDSIEKKLALQDGKLTAQDQKIARQDEELQEMKADFLKQKIQGEQFLKDLKKENEKKKILNHSTDIDQSYGILKANIKKRQPGPGR